MNAQDMLILWCGVAGSTLGVATLIAVLLDRRFPADPELRAMRARHRRADKRRARQARELAALKARLS